jgi:hypothetical protein
MKLRLFHPDSPGMRVNVERGWLKRLLYPKDFATLGEAVKAGRKNACT